MNNNPSAIPADYELTIDLNTLNHLGIGLYSNVPAVVSEVVANSYDADAEKVDIQIDSKKKIITITDDGWGMTKEDANKKYLKVGYEKRKELTITPKGRHVMGRKGIGKLSLFSIANIIEITTVKLDLNGQVIEKNGFVMNADDIKNAIESGKIPYCPTPIDESQITIKKGTKIILRGIKKNIDSAESSLRKRLARRFTVIGKEHDFEVSVNRKAITIEDRDYFKKIEYLWHIGEGSEKYIEYCSNITQHMFIDGIVGTDIVETDEKGRVYAISGWVGTFDEQKSIEEGNNTISILAWGKLVHEDVLKDIKEGGVFTKYLIGEIRADFLDEDKLDDIATTNRQSLKEDDPRFEKLKEYIQNKILKVIQSKWRDWRNVDAEKKALENPKIKEWFDQLTSDNRKYARVLFSKIEGFPIENQQYKKELYKHGILAFETLALKQNLSSLEKLNSESDFEFFTSVFNGLDELEAVHYYQIIKGRLEVLKKFEKILPAAKERLIQEHIFDHLWLLDSSWERASTDQRMEETVTTEFKKVDAKLTPDELAGRLDIRYRTAVGKHIIIELKKYKRKVKSTELVEQVRKYRSALLKCLKGKHPDLQQIIEIICILGNAPEPQDEEKENIDLLASVGARYITYDQLIRQTRDSYRDYIDKQKEISRIRELIDSI